MATATIQSQAEMTISILDLSLEEVNEGKVVNVGSVENLMRYTYTFILLFFISMGVYAQPRINKTNDFKIIKEASLKNGIVRWKYDRYDEKWDSIPQKRKEDLSSYEDENCVGITTQIATKDNQKYYFIIFDQGIEEHEYPDLQTTTHMFLMSEADFRSIFLLPMGNHKIEIYEIKKSLSSNKPLLRDEDLNKKSRWKELIVRREDENTIRFIPPSSGDYDTPLSLEYNYFEVSAKNWNSLSIDAENISFPPHEMKSLRKLKDEKVYDVADIMPSYPGGTAALMKFLSQNIQYPADMEEAGVYGRVICTFVVEKDGSITDIRVSKSVCPSLDKEAVRVIGSMPKWNPAKQNGESVRCKYSLPVTFRL